MTYEVKLPTLGDDGGDTATVSYWLVEEGDSVKEGEDIVELTTDKAAVSAEERPVTGEIRAGRRRGIGRRRIVRFGNLVC